MTDDHELAGLHPYVLLDEEAGRLDAIFVSLSDAGWSRPSRCAGWSVRDVLGHLAAGEDYHRACLDGTVAQLMAGYASRGATDLDSANAVGVADYSALSPAEALHHWQTASAENRRRFRERGDGLVDTSIGEYPCRWQAFHVASELATHADDIAAPLTIGRNDRMAWRVRVSRFALAEAKPQLEIRAVVGRTVVTDGTQTVEVSDAELIDAVMQRLDEDSPIGGAGLEMLSTMPSP
jgi:uncharacterized protein (TIGR03083 family)